MHLPGHSPGEKRFLLAQATMIAATGRSFGWRWWRFQMVACETMLSGSLGRPRGFGSAPAGRRGMDRDASKAGGRVDKR